MNAQQNSRLGFVVAGLLLGILMAAMDNTIVSTAMATIVSELGGLSKSITSMFWWTLVPAVLALITVCFMGSAKMMGHGPGAASVQEAKPAASK